MKNAYLIWLMSVVLVLSMGGWTAAEEGAGAMKMTADAQPAIVNLVENPGFEESDVKVPDCPAGFTPGHAGKTRQAKLTWEKPGYSGKKAIAVETVTSDDLGYWETIIPVKPETEYIISFYYKCESVRNRKIQAGDPEYNKGGPGGPNLELGVVPDDATELTKLTDWTDIGIALGPVGGTWLPLATEWSFYRQTVKTAAGQTRLKLKLRLYCYAQKVWFDDLSIVELASLPKVEISSPGADVVIDDGKPKFQWKGMKGIKSYLVECSLTPAFSRDVTKRVTADGESIAWKEALPKGRCFWQVGALDNHGIPFWFAESSFEVGKTWAGMDTTPPAAHSPKPVPNAKADAGTEISAAFSESGSGIEPASATVILDGKDVSTQAVVTAGGITLRPANPLAKGAHRVEVSVADKAGNRSNVLAWQFGVDEFLVNKVRIEGKQIFLNDRPYFPIGIYRSSYFIESGAAQAAVAGFDVVLDSLPPLLEMLNKHGMMCLLNLTTDMKSTDTPESAKVALTEKGQAQFKNHPCVLGYWADDPENLDNTEGTPLPESTRIKLANSRKALKEWDPDHPFVAAFSNLPRLRASVPFFDIMLSYTYPVPHRHPQMIYGWGLAYVYSVVDQTYVDLKPVWFNSQACDLGFGEKLKSKDGFRPTPEEMRAMAYYSLALGVGGWTAYLGKINEENNPAHWHELLKMASEMRYLAPALAAGGQGKTVSLKEDSSSGSVYFREIVHEGSHTLIAVNMSAGRVAACWSFIEPVQAKVLFEDRKMAEKSNEIRDVFKPFEVHIYRW